MKSSRHSSSAKPVDAHWSICENATMVPRFNARMAHNAVVRVNANGVPGDVVELGVWKGGLSCMMALAQRLHGDSARPRTHWLFDTFEGMPAPTGDDDRRSRWYYSRITNGTAKSAPGGVRDGKWAYAPLDDVRRTIARTGMPEASFRFVKGKVEDTLRDPSITLPRAIAVLRLDTDWYESTRVELEVLWPLVSPGGWMYVDDYSAFGGSRKAVDQWLQRKGWATEAQSAHAFLRGSARPKEGCAEDHLGAFQVWKTSSTLESEIRERPFQIMPLAQHCAPHRAPHLVGK